MNAPPWAVDALIALEERGFDVQVLADTVPDRGDGQVRLTLSGSHRSYPLEIKARIRSNGVESAARRQPPPLILTHHMTPSLARACRDLGVHFADSSGNMYVDWGDVLVDVEGRRTERPTLEHDTVRWLAPAGLKVLFCLLSFGGLVKAPYRAIATASGTSLGATQMTMKDLASSGFLDLDHRRLHNTRALYDRWVDSYLIRLERSLVLGHYQIANVAQSLREELPAGTSWGGEAAASLTGSNLRPSTLMIYALERPDGLLARWRARRGSPDDYNLVVRKRFWERPGAQPGPNPLTVPAALVYADLIASTDPRQLAAANELRTTDDLLRAIDSR